MASGTCVLTPNLPNRDYQKAYRATIRSIETALRRGEVPDFDGEIERLQTTVLNGGPADAGRMAAYSDYRSIITGKCDAPRDHPTILFGVGPGEGAVRDLTITIREGERSVTRTIRGAIDASRLSEADRERYAGDRNYTTRRVLVVDENRTLVEKTLFIPVDRHPVTKARRPLLAKTN